MVKGGLRPPGRDAGAGGGPSEGRRAHILPAARGAFEVAGELSPQRHRLLLVTWKGSKPYSVEKTLKVI